MPIRPEINSRYETVSGRTVQITEPLGKTGMGGYVLGTPNHYSVWDFEGKNQEDPEWDLRRKY